LQKPSPKRLRGEDETTLQVGNAGRKHSYFSTPKVSTNKDISEEGAVVKSKFEETAEGGHGVHSYVSQERRKTWGGGTTVKREGRQEEGIDTIDFGTILQKKELDAPKESYISRVRVFKRASLGYTKGVYGRLLLESQTATTKTKINECQRSPVRAREGGPGKKTQVVG